MCKQMPRLSTSGDKDENSAISGPRKALIVQPV